MRRIVDEIEAKLRAVGTRERAVREKRYLKSELEHLGATVPATRKIVVDVLRANPDWNRVRILTLAEGLWEKPIHERRSAAVEVLEQRKELLLPVDMGFVEELLRQSRGWALVDNLAAHVAGYLAESSPAEVAPVLDRWARDDDFWIRRSALLALLLPLRRGEGDFARFCRYADSMLEEKEFFIRKAIGWVLRETAKKTPARVVDWLLPRAGRASGLTLREASRSLSEADKNRIEKARAASAMRR
ncbi:MAG: DNA alkylation repair protein [Polyangiaceae bacterium]|jgi:3-methyladenine DNA glycosylase AlkD